MGGRGGSGAGSSGGGLAGPGDSTRGQGQGLAGPGQASSMGGGLAGPTGGFGGSSGRTGGMNSISNSQVSGKLPSELSKLLGFGNTQSAFGTPGVNTIGSSRDAPAGLGGSGTGTNTAGDIKGFLTNPIAMGITNAALGYLGLGALSPMLAAMRLNAAMSQYATGPSKIGTGQQSGNLGALSPTMTNDQILAQQAQMQQMYQAYQQQMAQLAQYQQQQQQQAAATTQGQQVNPADQLKWWKYSMGVDQGNQQ